MHSLKVGICGSFPWVQGRKASAGNFPFLKAKLLSYSKLNSQPRFALHPPLARKSVGSLPRLSTSGDLKGTFYKMKNIKQENK